jgi:uncharacterized phiE125 gp8 family phage protein
VLKIKKAAAIEPISLEEVRLHLRLDPGVAGDTSTVQTIAHGAHAVAAAYSLVGTPIDVLGYGVLVNLVCLTNGASGTVDVKIQESDDNVSWSDAVTFTQVTEANDNATYGKAYTGIKRYIRAVATVAVANCDFGVDIVKSGATSVEDTLITGLIQAAREYCEGFQSRAFITQSWYLWLDAWPEFFEIPMSPLQSITSIKYYDTANTEYTLAATEYFVDVNSTPGRVALAYGKSWPSTGLRAVNGICVEFTCGYGATAASVPMAVRQAMLLLIGHWYENREAGADKPLTPIPLAVDSLLWMDRVF